MMPDDRMGWAAGVVAAEVFSLVADVANNIEHGERADCELRSSWPSSLQGVVMVCGVASGRHLRTGAVREPRLAGATAPCTVNPPAVYEIRQLRSARKLGRTAAFCPGEHRCRGHREVRAQEIAVEWFRLRCRSEGGLISTRAGHLES